MNCKRMRRLLSDEWMANGPEHEAAALQAHLRECEACRRLRHDLATIDAELRAQRGELPIREVDIVNRAIDAVLAQPGRTIRRRYALLAAPVWRFSVIGAAGSLLLAIIGIRLAHQGKPHLPQHHPAVIAPREARGLPGSAESSASQPTVSNEKSQPVSVATGNLQASGGQSHSLRISAGDIQNEKTGGSGLPAALNLSMIRRRPQLAASARARGMQKPAVNAELIRADGDQLPFPRMAAVSGRLIAAALQRYEREREQRPRSALEGVPELARPVTFAEMKIPLGTLVRRVARATGVPLVAASEVADEPVAVVVNDIPARDLLIQVADMLDYQWARRGKMIGSDGAKQGGGRYEIWQDLASKHREDALRQVIFLEAQERFQEQIDRLASMADLSPEQIRAVVEAPEKSAAVRGLPTDSPEGREFIRRYELAVKVASPIPRALVLLLGRLTPQHWALLSANQPAIFSTNPGPGELPLPRDIAGLLRASLPLARSPWISDSLGQAPDAERLRESLRQREQATQDQWKAASEYRVIIRVESNRLQPGGLLSLTARAEPLRAGVPVQVPSAIGTDLELLAGAGDSLLRREENTPERQAALARDPVVGVAKRFQPVEKRSVETAADGDGAWTMRHDWAWRRWDQLPDLARTYRVNFIADAYRSNYAGLMPIILPPSSEPVPLSSLLDRLVGISHHWDRVPPKARIGGLIRLRSRTWFLDRPREIPMRLVQRWNALSEQEGALPLEECVTMVTTLLSDVQLDTLPQLAFQGEVAARQPDLDAVANGRDTLRLYGALSPSQRHAMWSGLRLPMAQMTPAQRSLFQSGLDRIKPRDTTLSMDELQTALFSLTAERRMMVVDQRSGGITYRVENLSVGDGRREGAPPAAASAGPRTPATPVPEPVRRYPVTQVTFHYSVGAQHFDLTPLTVAASR